MSGGLVSVGGILSKGTYGTINLRPGGTLQIGTGGTTGVLAASLTNDGTLVFNRSDASTYSSVLSGPGAISKQGVGSLRLSGANTLTGPTTIQQGTVQLAHASALSASTISVLSGGTLALMPGLVTTIGGLRPNGGGVVDVGNGSITVLDGLSSFNLYASLSVGRGSGVWDGARGIKSIAATESGGTRTVGWLDNGDGSLTFGYAAPGDTNLDWQIDVLDVANFLGSGKFNTGLSATWAEGDSNYDGFADVLDIADFMSTGLFNAGSYNTPPASIAAVPEPSTLGLVGLGAGLRWLAAARRRRAA
jgi:autotransporter-associated beta strand protein